MIDTATTMFLVPGLGINVEQVRFRYGFLNGYLGDIDVPSLGGNEVYLLFKPKNLVDFQGFVIHERQRTKLLKDDYDHAGGYVVLLYDFPPEFDKEFKLFLKGKYSKFRDKYVVLLPHVDSRIDKEGNPFTEPSLQFMICYKAKALKEFWEKKLDIEMDEDQEFWSEPDKVRETLNIAKIKQSEL